MIDVPSTPTMRPPDRAVQHMTADRVLGVVLILLQLVVLGYLSGARLFPVAMGVLTLWGLRTRLRLRIEPVPLSLMYAIGAIGFLLHYMFAPYPLPVDSQFIRSPLAHSLARLLITVQVLQLFLHQQHRRLPIWLASCGAVALIFATNLRVPQLQHMHVLGGIAAFTGTFALYSSRARRIVPLPSGGGGGARWIVMTAALLLVMVLGSGGSWALQKHDRKIEWFLSEYLGYSGRTSRAGFNPSGRLEAVTAWRTDGADRIVLRIFSEDAPGYLRGAVFDTYRGSSRETSYTPWTATSYRRPLSQTSGGRSELKQRPGDLLFEISPDRTSTTRTLDIWPDEAAEPTFFIPLSTSTLAVRDSDVRIDANGVLSQQERMYAVPYMLTAGTTDSSGRDTMVEELSADEYQQLSTLDVPIAPAVETLAKDVFAGCDTAREKIDAVQRYFLANYQYKLGINVPHSMDPVTYFLTRRPPAHCEYFATGTAVLLRQAGVPCRYVVGFVAAEWNDAGHFWVARQRDAHAWVEAYDGQADRWVIVESTPAAGVPQPRNQNYAADLADSLRHWLSIFQIRLREYGLAGLLSSLVEVVWSIPGLIVLLGVFAAVLIQHRPQPSQRTGRQRISDPLRKLHRELARLDRQARRAGFERAPQETLTSFARRLRTSSAASGWSRSVADCYTLYVDLRYRGRSGPEAVRKLQQARARLT